MKVSVILCSQNIYATEVQDIEVILLLNNTQAYLSI